MHRKQMIGFAVTFCLCVTGLFSLSSHAGGFAAAAETKTGTGLANHVMEAYDQGWKYRYGCYGQYIGGARRSDCSGLIKSYLWWTGDKSDPRPGLMSVAGSSGAMLASASAKGTVSGSGSIPRIQGLILYSPGHVGVYVGDNMEVDNRCTGENMRYEKVIGNAYHWKYWFKLPQLKYPTNGFAQYDGHTYYYENGQYVVSTTKVIDGTSYTFDSHGILVSGTGNTQR